MTIGWFVVAVVAVALVVFVTALFSIKYFLENDQKKRLLELKYESKSLVTPLRIQAYERISLFLERIDLNQLILRINNPDLTAQQMKTLLIASIRAEYEHNLSQQIFVSSEVWEQIVQVKEESIKLINLSAGELSLEATSLDLATILLAKTAEKATNETAMATLKREVGLLF